MQVWRFHTVLGFSCSQLDMQRVSCGPWQAHAMTLASLPYTLTPSTNEPVLWFWGEWINEHVAHQQLPRDLLHVDVHVLAAAADKFDGQVRSRLQVQRQLYKP